MEESALEITTAASGQPRDSLLLHHRPYVASTRSLSPSPLLSDRSFPSLSLSFNPDRKAASESDTMQAVREEEEQVVEEVVRAGAVAEEEGPEEKEVAMVGEEMAEAEHDEEEAEAGASAKKNRIQVSTNKKPLYFYVNLAKVYIYFVIAASILFLFLLGKNRLKTVSEILWKQSNKFKSKQKTFLWICRLYQCNDKMILLYGHMGNKEMFFMREMEIGGIQFYFIRVFYWLFWCSILLRNCHAFAMLFIWPRS